MQTNYPAQNIVLVSLQVWSNTGPARLGSAVSHFGPKSPPAGRSGATGWLLMSAAQAYRVSARVRDRLSD